MAAALLSRTSSAIHGAFGGHTLENAAALLVEPGIDAVGQILEAASGRGIVVQEHSSLSEDLNRHHRRGDAQVDEIDVLVQCRRQTFLKIEAKHGIDAGRRKNGQITLTTGDQFLRGERIAPAFPWGQYRERWERRGERQPDDGDASPWCRSSYSWDGVAEGRIPWAALKSAWRRESAIPCPNCDTPLAAWGFTWRHRTLLSMSGHVARCCFGCRRDFREDTGDPWPWMAATLDADLLPVSQDDGLRKTDLRPRWPAPPRNLRDLDNLPADLTTDELVSILM